MIVQNQPNIFTFEMLANVLMYILKCSENEDYQVETTLETSGEDVKLHSKRVEKM